MSKIAPSTRLREEIAMCLEQAEDEQGARLLSTSAVSKLTDAR